MQYSTQYYQSNSRKIRIDNVVIIIQKETSTKMFTPF